MAHSTGALLRPFGHWLSTWLRLEIGRYRTIARIGLSRELLYSERRRDYVLHSVPLLGSKALIVVKHGSADSIIEALAVHRESKVFPAHLATSDGADLGADCRFVHDPRFPGYVLIGPSLPNCDGVVRLSEAEADGLLLALAGHHSKRWGRGTTR